MTFQRMCPSLPALSPTQKLETSNCKCENKVVSLKCANYYVQYEGESAGYDRDRS